MDKLNLNNILNREISEKLLKEFLINKKNKGLYVHGTPGCGKTIFIKNYLKQEDYDIIYYDTSELRNKCMLSNINNNNMSNTNVLDMMKKKKKKLVIVMDEIDSMNNGDKGGLNTLIKIIRNKKTKKQKLESYSNNYIICIGNTTNEKKVNELNKICNIIHLNTPTKKQMLLVVNKIMPNLDNDIIDIIINYVDSDLRKLKVIYNLYEKQNNFNFFKEYIIKHLIYKDNTKNIVYDLFNHNYSMDKHKEIINEQDRTVVALLWHENIIDILEKLPPSKKLKVYNEFLKNICFSDFIDRLTFQKQIWQFTEYSSLIKTFYNNYLLHKNKISNKKINTIRFTKVLTKYSTEYNNKIFLIKLSQKNNSDIDELFVNYVKNPDYKNENITE